MDTRMNAEPTTLGKLFKGATKGKVKLAGLSRFEDACCCEFMVNLVLGWIVILATMRARLRSW
jgi:hypothetical protein